MRDEITKEREEMEERNTSESTGKKGNGKGRSRRGRGRGPKKEKPDYAKDKSNDVSWYANNKQILDAAASFSYFNPVGAPLGLEKFNSNANIDFAHNDVPGIMALPYVATPGYAGTIQDPVNVAADNIYSYVRYQNSGAKNYDSVDLMLYLLAMDSIYSWWAKAVRAYGSIRIYSQTNRYLPRAVLAAQGFDPDDVIGREAEFRGKINAMAAQIQAFCVPATLPIFTRHFWMESNIYTDNDVFKPQLYLYKSVAYRYYDEYEEGGGRLVAVANPDFSSVRGMTIDDWYTVMKNMLNRVNKSEDIGIMSGDILKAFGRENLFSLTAINSDYAVLPVYNEEVLMQIENLEIGPLFNPTGTIHYNNIQSTNIEELNIEQIGGGSNLLKFAPRWNSAYPLEFPHILNFHRNDITPEHAMVATRMKAHWKQLSFIDADTSNPVWQIETCGTEIAFMPEIYFTSSDDFGFTRLNVPGYNDAQAVSVAYEEFILSMLTDFDWHPNVWVGTHTGAGETLEWHIVDYFFDMANYTVLGEKQLDQTHICAVLSEFKIPVLGSF